jgi:hypothetical protein
MPYKYVIQTERHCVNPLEKYVYEVCQQGNHPNDMFSDNNNDNNDNNPIYHGIINLSDNSNSI